MKHVPTLSGLVVRLAAAGCLLTTSQSQAADNPAPPPADVVPYAGLSALDAAKFATAPKGFKLHLFAGEPDIIQPIAFAEDDRGRIWVAEGLCYPKKRPDGQGLDRILVFEDTNGDHQFDKKTVFMEGLNLVSGMEVGFGGVWVGAAPELMFIPVSDWDNPKPAGPAQVVLDGWDFNADTHETLNTFSWGPDGWLYGCHGVFCPSLVGKPGTPSSERQWVDAAVWRYHPLKKRFEVFAEGTSNPWGVDFDDYGQCWEEACVIPHLWHMIQGARYERQGGEHYPLGPEETARYGANQAPRKKPVHPHIYDNIHTTADHVHYAGNQGPHAANGRSDAAGGGHAHAGMMAYLGDSWPAEYRNRLFMGNIHGQRLNMDIPERRGSGFVGHHGPDFLNFNDTWSQVLNFRYDQDGSVYLIDWYDKNQCHHNNIDGHDRSNGRIFKLVYNDQAVSKVDLQKATDQELALYQLHRNDWYVRHSRRVLMERASKGNVAPAAVKLLKDLIEKGDAALPSGKPAWALSASETTRRLRLLWALHVTGGLDQELLGRLLADKDEYVRAWSIQMLCEDRNVAPASVQQLAAMARDDKSQVVRLYLSSATQRIAPKERLTVLSPLMTGHPEDAQDQNLPLMAWYAFEPLAADPSAEMLKLSRSSPLPRLFQFTARRIASQATPEALALVAQALATETDTARQRDLVDALGAALAGRRSLPKPDGWDAVEKAFASHPDALLKTRVLSLSLVFGSTEAPKQLRDTVADAKAPAPARQAALASLLAARDKELAPTLFPLLKDNAMRSAALRGLATFEDPATAAAILDAFPQLPAGERRDALQTLTTRPSYATTLLAALESGRVPAKEMSADLQRNLRNLKLPAVDAYLEKAFGKFRELSADKLKEIDHYKKLYWAGGSQPGDALRGRVMFARVCQQCHTLFGSGGKVGPDITGSNRGDLDYLLQNVLDPNAVIPNEYRAWNVDTKDGRSLTALIRSQDARSITLSTANETLTLPRDEVTSMQQGELSMMPEGLLTPLADQEIRDLLYYLTRPGQVPLLATPDTLPLFFNGKDLAGWEGTEGLWSVENSEIVGRSAAGLPHNEFLKSQMLIGDFRLTLKIKLTPNKENSGVQFRSEAHGDYEMKGYQADAGAGWWGKLYEENGRAILWDKGAEAAVKVDDWNTYEIIAIGSRIRTSINGQRSVDLDDPKGAKAGIIGLQMHAGGPIEVRFKDLQLELNPKPDLLSER